MAHGRSQASPLSVVLCFRRLLVCWAGAGLNLLSRVAATIEAALSKLVCAMPSRKPALPG